MNHGIADVFAFQEALLIDAVFGIALLTMMWSAFGETKRTPAPSGRK